MVLAVRNSEQVTMVPTRTPNIPWGVDVLSCLKYIRHFGALGHPVCSSLRDVFGNTIHGSILCSRIVEIGESGWQYSIPQYDL